MRSFIITFVAFITIMLATRASFGQRIDSTQRQALVYISNYLQVDTGTAHRVTEIQEGYKQKIRAVASNTSLTEREKRSAIGKLIEDKNRSLEPLITSQQQLEKLIPTTERRIWQKRDSTIVKQ